MALGWGIGVDGSRLAVPIQLAWDSIGVAFCACLPQNDVCAAVPPILSRPRRRGLAKQPYLPAESRQDLPRALLNDSWCRSFDSAFPPRLPLTSGASNSMQHDAFLVSCGFACSMLACNRLFVNLEHDRTCQLGEHASGWRGCRV